MARNGNETMVRALMKCQHRGQQGKSVDQCETWAGVDCVTRLPYWERKREVWLSSQVCGTARKSCKDRTREWISRRGIVSSKQTRDNWIPKLMNSLRLASSKFMLKATRSILVLQPISHQFLAWSSNHSDQLREIKSTVKGVGVVSKGINQERDLGTEETR